MSTKKDNTSRKPGTPRTRTETAGAILVQGARQNNLKNVSIRLPLNELIVITGVSGSGKSSLAFDTLYAEGQRRYVETFSPYARQFLDRMDKPNVDHVDGIPPAIAIDQTNPVRTSRSTVGTMTELNDHIKLLFARAAQLHCRGCGKPVRRDSAESIADQLLAPSGTKKATRQASPEILITFSVPVPRNFSEAEVRDMLVKRGYRRIRRKRDDSLEVIQDRVQKSEARRARIVEDLEAALKHGQGHVALYNLNARRKRSNPKRFSSSLHCPDCDIDYRDPTPSLFSFNSPLGACETCRGFGRTIGIDYDLVIPDGSKTLAQGAIKPWQTDSYRECRDDLIRFAHRRGIPVGVPWNDLTDEQKTWVLDGEGEWEDKVWYGVKRFFEWLETKSYRMHIRVLLSKYRAYRPCASCGGARLKPDALLWRLGPPGLTVHEVMLLPVDRCHRFFSRLRLPAPLDEATELLLTEIRSRLRYLLDVGLGYLTLDRQSRTLSGGEVQRINLTTALGTSLVNTLFVLDEPSIGLHPRDIRRLIRVLHRLRDAGNTLVVVEHDPGVIRAADRILDMGPGPGQQGGQVVFYGEQRALLKSETSLTAEYLSGRRKVVPSKGKAAGSRAQARGPHLDIVGAAEHNLKNIDVRIPLRTLVCVTGVSGSGKSTLVQDVCYNALRRLQHKPTETPGRHRAIRGHEQLHDVVLVDQSPIGKTTRSNPASYVGALDAIRKLFSAEPLARERGYTAGTFSFNTGNGRCPTCGGNGFERVEMQFLSDVYLRCPDCDGRRYRQEVLDVKRPAPGRGAPKSMAGVLEMTVAEANEFFSDCQEVRHTLHPLQEVGLSYLKLGQPVPTLSGGEAQRLKLCGHLAKARGGGSQHPQTLFLFDEPTTGLHFHDIAVLLAALRKLLDAGHSVVVIEHNLDVIRAADWIIDLGPEGGEAGGEVVCTGPPDAVAKCRGSRTGAVLRQNRRISASAVKPKGRPDARREISIHNAREHNLKNIGIRIPRDRFTVITGISGSGKSTVAFDILFAEGQRRYLESLNAYARQFVQPSTRPDVDAIFGIPPTVAIEQRTSRGGRKSTVATVTETYHFLRLLFAKLGTQYCPDCRVPIEPQTRERILARILAKYRGRRLLVLAPLVVARKGYYTDLAKWAAGKGFAHLRVDGEMLPTDNWPRLSRFQEHDIELPADEFVVSHGTAGRLRQSLDLALDIANGTVYVLPVVRRGADGRPPVVFSTRRACPRCQRSFEELDPRLFSFNSKHGWCPRCFGTGLETTGANQDQAEEAVWNESWDGSAPPCPACSGRRLRPEALAVRFRDRTIADVARLSVDAAEKTFRTLRCRGREADIARDILQELRSRLAFLKQVGLPYLSLDRAVPTLSGGEAQRIRLASQLGSNLRGVCVILDEPTIGLHARDNLRLLETLGQLQANGNTIVVVEHDAATISRAQHVVDLGPGAGVNGGHLVVQGSVEKLRKDPHSVTGRFLSRPLRHPLVDRTHRRAADSTSSLEVKGAHLHNLKQLDVRIPLQRVVCVTGVSGSGKSTLVRDVLYKNLRHRVGRARSSARRKPGPLHGCSGITGTESLQRVLEVDQTPIGKTPRSCPATYIGFWDDIRRLFAETADSRIRGYGAGRFSFNVQAGRCEVCTGQGVKKIEMSFLPNVSVTCEACGGRRFTPETLAVRLKDKTIARVLDMSVDEAAEFFAAHTSVHRALGLLQDVGLGYLTLGQPSPTLSGGEAQRIKLVTELAKARLPIPLRGKPTRSDPRPGIHSLYVLDEPTIGLHMADVEKLILVLHRLVDAGNTIVIIEHNLDIIAEADWIVDLGPEGGDRGGRIVAQGTPTDIAGMRNRSTTGKFLYKFLREANP